MAVWSQIAYSEAITLNRMDAEYFRPENLADLQRLKELRPQPLCNFAFVTDGIHASPEIAPEGGVRYLSAKCVKDNAFALADALSITDSQNAANKRTQLRPGDVLITSVGTIGNAAVVQPDILPANADRHLGIVRLNQDAGLDPYYVASFLNSRYGRFQSIREATGNVQLNLFIEKIKTLLVPRLPVEKAVAEATQTAYATRRKAEELYAEAEATLTATLGLDRVDLTPRLFYEDTYAHAAGAARFDAEYHSPRMQNVIKTLSTSGKTIGDVVTLMKRRFKAIPGKPFDYIEIADVSTAGTAGSSTVAGEDAPGRATWTVKPGDIITTTVRPIRRLSAIILPEQDGFVCSSGFAVLRPRDIEPELLLTYLRLPLVAELLDLYTTASMYPAISTADLLRIPLQIPDERTRTTIASMVRVSLAARAESISLLDEAKNMVENAIVPLQSHIQT